MFKKKTEIHAVPTETVTGLALKQSLEPITQITKSLKENRKSLIEEEMQTASQISDIQGSFDTILAQSDQVASGMDSIRQRRKNSLPMDSMMPACGGYRRHAESVPIPYIPGLATRADFSPQSYRKRQMV